MVVSGILYASYDVSIKICKIWDAAQKYEKLDVGSFAAVKCNDAFAAGPGDISKYFCKKTYLGFANIVRLHNL